MDSTSSFASKAVTMSSAGISVILLISSIVASLPFSLVNCSAARFALKRFIGRGVEAEDLFQIGTIGLMKAIDKFDPDYDVKFSTYAVPLVVGEIKRFLRDDGMVKVSRSLKENAWKAKRAAEQFTKENGREATIEERRSS